jgi:hypothetical protein
MTRRAGTRLAAFSKRQRLLEHSKALLMTFLLKGHSLGKPGPYLVAVQHR